MSSKKNANGKEGTSADERFSRIKRDPRFWEMPDRERKIKIDKRFTSMFHDERFSIKSTVDKRGRPVESTTADDLRRFYQISEDGSDEDDDEEKEEEEENEDDASEDEEDEDSGSESGEDSGPDLARGKGNVETSSDEDDEDDVDGVLQREEEEIQHDWGELCKDAVRSEQVWRRLAICNVDWDRLKAKDLLAILNSFKPEGGAVLSVKIYPSEFGKERLKLEESQGPMELKALPDDSEDDTEDDRLYREKRRDYQFKRLKYFYAVAECDSAATAAKIYQECDGFEYESSCSVLDLRFIPDDMTFEDSPKDVATDVNLATYTPKLFTSSANATSKVQLTWDETDQERVSALNRKFDKSDLLDMDYKAYLASSSEDEDVEEVRPEEENEDDEEGEQENEKKNMTKKTKSEDQIEKYRQLLRGLESKQQQEDKDMEMEITWVPGLKETTEQLVKKKLEQKEPQLTPWEDFLKKKKEKKKKKNQKKGNNEDEDELSDDELPSDVDLADPFFSRNTLGADVKNKNKDKKKKKQDEDDDERQRMDKHKAEMSLLMDDGDEDERHKHFNYDKLVEQQNLSRKKKKKMMKNGDALLEDNFQVDVSDPRFEAMFTSHLFNLDPSHPSYKQTRGTQSILEEKRRRRQEEEEEEERRGAEDDGGAREASEKPNERDVKAETSTDASLSLLVKSIKSKTKDFQARKKAKLF
ncbi:ESF1 homolog [Corythoichthys intestinalis]|uniref:ESF1 homolog n=1 Tax=Corythoichthys intestinalis TaxID=161448 RepID=UPI0025A5BE22|nr:ESF1 homolog [Corythoichthys intestinalis]